MAFLETINDIKSIGGQGYTKVASLAIGYEYTIIDCRLKKTTFGDKIALYLSDREGKPLWIFLPKAFVIDYF
ncbi:hypothetical protein ACLKA7_005107 [Drosophila subpalustris]